VRVSPAHDSLNVHVGLDVHASLGVHFSLDVHVLLGVHYGLGASNSRVQAALSVRQSIMAFTASTVRQAGIYSEARKLNGVCVCVHMKSMLSFRAWAAFMPCHVCVCMCGWVCVSVFLCVCVCVCVCVWVCACMPCLTVTVAMHMRRTVQV